MNTILSPQPAPWQPDPAEPCVDMLGRPLTDLRISVIDQCNFRCTYCMPAGLYPSDYPFLPSSARLSFAQIETMARAFVRLGVDKIRITGGEPLLRKNLERLIERLARLATPDGRAVRIALTTNGSLLAAKSRSLKDAGLDRVTVSLDSLDNGIFQRMNGVDFPVEKVLHGIATAQAVGLHPVKVNMVVQKGVNDSQIVPLARHFRHTGVVLRLIEFMDVGGIGAWSRTHVVTSDAARALIDAEFPLVALGEGKPILHETASRYRYRDRGGEVGFISSVSQPFCGDCSRVRVSSDGQMFLCLFARDGIDLRPHLVTAQALETVLRRHWRGRGDRYSEVRGALAQAGGRPGKQYATVRMSLVGG
ncbi:GTP 3',8-cyclase MoaA [Janthinobacterium sp.]|uniref:GTP 3',8-cyclase MoaA n=1 Tax=Janthinobacterium sp. TaxID=1871054 RepID=UPI0025BE6629|nr:GTP 3',8-cyclase MoaA [Janthinobacterium sp.]NBV15459.1 GTP 3',8-cyclase MoaA [Janthinobacterium sp.]